MARRRTKYTEAFKREAVNLLLTRGDRTAGDVAESLNVGENMLWRWKRKYEGTPATGSSKGGGESPEEELKRLRRENAQLRQDREVLLKSVAVFAKERT